MPEAGRLVITVVENPTINQIAFEGNDSLDDEELYEVVQLRPRLAYSVPAAEADAQRIIAAYQAAGRYAASVTPVIIRLPENRVDLVYEITEGRRTGGAAHQLHRQPGLLRPPAAAGGRDQPVELAELPASAAPPTTPTGSSSTRSCCAASTSSAATSTSGCCRRPPSWRASGPASSCPSRCPRASGSTSATSRSARRSRGSNAAAFQPLLAPVANRGVYNVALVDRVIERMAYQAGQAGYAFVEIRPQVTRNPATRTVDINFELVEGQRVFVERIDITGNTRTLDRVIRRQFRHRRGRRLQRARDPRRRGPHQRSRLLRVGDRQRAPGHDARARRWSRSRSRSSRPAA